MASVSVAAVPDHEWRMRTAARTRRNRVPAVLSRDAGFSGGE